MWYAIVAVIVAGAALSVLAKIYPGGVFSRLAFWMPAPKELTAVESRAQKIQNQKRTIGELQDDVLELGRQVSTAEIKVRELESELQVRNAKVDQLLLAGKEDEAEAAELEWQKVKARADEAAADLAELTRLKTDAEIAVRKAREDLRQADAEGDKRSAALTAARTRAAAADVSAAVSSSLATGSVIADDDAKIAEQTIADEAHVRVRKDLGTSRLDAALQAVDRMQSESAAAESLAERRRRLGITS